MLDFHLEFVIKKALLQMFLSPLNFAPGSAIMDFEPMIPWLFPFMTK